MTAEDGGGGGRDRRPRGRERPFGPFPLIVLFVLVVGGLFLMFKLRAMSAIQDCVWSGRKNCAPIDSTDEK